MKKKILIEGMIHNSSVEHIKEALGNIDLIINILVDFEYKTVVIDYIGKIENSTIVETIDSLGYSVISIEQI